MDELNGQIEQRIKKLDRLRSLGIDPFGGKFNVKDRASDVISPIRAGHKGRPGQHAGARHAGRPHNGPAPVRDGDLDQFIEAYLLQSLKKNDKQGK